MSADRRAYWERRKDGFYARGLCVSCGRRPHRPDRVRCWECSGAECLRQRTRPFPLVRRCGKCREVTTHDRRRCAA